MNDLGGVGALATATAYLPRVSSRTKVSLRIWRPEAGAGLFCSDAIGCTGAFQWLYGQSLETHHACRTNLAKGIEAFLVRGKL